MLLPFVNDEAVLARKDLGALVASMKQLLKNSLFQNSQQISVHLQMLETAVFVWRRTSVS